MLSKDEHVASGSASWLWDRDHLSSHAQRARQPVTGREPVTGVGTGAAGTGGVCVVGAGGVVGGGVVGGVLAQVQVGAGDVGVVAGVVGACVGVAAGHFTQNTFCLAAPFSPVKFQKSL